MAIAFQCPACQRQYRVKDRLAGKCITCKSCKGAIQVPAGLNAQPNDDFMSSLDDAVKSATTRPLLPPAQATKPARKTRTSKQASAKRNRTRDHRPLDVAWLDMLKVGATVLALTLVISLVGLRTLVGSWNGAHLKNINVAYQNLPDTEDFTTDEPDSLFGETRLQKRAREAEWAIAANSEPIPNFRTLITWHFQNRPWLPAIFIVLEAIAIAIGVWMWRLNKDPHFQSGY